MSELIYYVAASLDGYIAGPDEDISWLFTDQDYGISDFMASVGPIAMGRRTYEIAQAFEPWPYSAHDVTVFTREAHYKVTTERTHVCHDEPRRWVEHVRSQTDENIWMMGGGQLAGAFLEEDLIDRIIVSYHPVVLGAGHPLFAGSFDDARFRLVRSQSWETGLIQVEFERAIE